MTITADDDAFATTLSMLTGLDKRVVLAWTVAETSGGTNGVRGYNFLNIGNTDSNPYGGPRWNSPQEAAQGTADWLRKNPASGAVILAAAGKPPDQQLAAIASSPFASSHYGNPPGTNLVRDYNGLTTAGQLGGLVESIPVVGSVASGAAGAAKTVADGISSTAGLVTAIGSPTFRYGAAVVALLAVALILMLRRPIGKAVSAGAKVAAVAA